MIAWLAQDDQHTAGWQIELAQCLYESKRRVCPTRVLADPCYVIDAVDHHRDGLMRSVLPCPAYHSREVFSADRETGSLLFKAFGCLFSEALDKASED